MLLIWAKTMAMKLTVLLVIVMIIIIIIIIIIITTVIAIKNNDGIDNVNGLKRATVDLVE